MIIKPAGMSRRGFLRNALGVTTALILPWRPREIVLTGVPYVVVHRPYFYAIFRRAALKRVIYPASNKTGGSYVGDGTNSQAICLTG